MTRAEAVARLIGAMEALEGVAEEPKGSNSGTMVERFLKAVGLKRGDPWCAAVVADAGKRALRDPVTKKSTWPLPMTGGCAYLHSWAAQRKVLRETPQVGDVFLLWYPSKGRMAHTGIITAVLPDGSCMTLEGNTSDGKSREGWGLLSHHRTFGAKDRFIRWTDLIDEG